MECAGIRRLMKAAGFPFSALGQQDEFQQSIQNVWADLLIIGIN